MSRKTIDVSIDQHGRDEGRVYRLTEAPASRVEEWAARALLGMARAGIEIPDNIAAAGFSGLVAVALRALPGMPWHELQPLLAEMMTCVQRVPDASKPGLVRALIEDDIEEVSTRLRLRKEIVALHADFSDAGDRSTSAPA